MSGIVPPDPQDTTREECQEGMRNISAEMVERCIKVAESLRASGRTEEAFAIEWIIDDHSGISSAVDDADFDSKQADMYLACVEAGVKYVTTLRQMIYAGENEVILGAWDRVNAEGSEWFSALRKAGIP